MQMMPNNPMVSHYLRLDAVMTTVDALNARRQLDEHAEAVKQVAIADRLLLTKTDLADPAIVVALEATL
jgi:G3E family GTPase